MLCAAHLIQLNQTEHQLVEFKSKECLIFLSPQANPETNSLLLLLVLLSNRREPGD